MMIRAVEEKRTEIDLDFWWAQPKSSTSTPHGRRTRPQFSQLAERYSEDEASRKRSGELGWISRASTAGCGRPGARGERLPRTDRAPRTAPSASAVAWGLAWVHEERDPISEEAFRDEVRRGRHVELRKRVLESIESA